jgi:hypothetical protein
VCSESFHFLSVETAPGGVAAGRMGRMAGELIATEEEMAFQMIERKTTRAM